MTSTVTVDKMRDKLWTLDDARLRLSATEPLGVHPFPVGDAIQFRVENGWNDNVEEIKATDEVNAYVTVGSGQFSNEYRLTKEALLEAGSLTGLSKAYVLKSPSRLTEDALNYWYRGGIAGRDFQLLTTGDKAAAITKETLVPFSNMRILNEVLTGIEDVYGVGEVLVDYKFHHSLTHTALRLIVPEYRRNIEGTGTENDTWSVGVEVRNSLTGDEQTSISGYLFRWWCTNGATNTHQAGVWSRKSNGQGEDVYDWARRSVDEVLGGLEHALDDVQATVGVNLQGDFNAMAQEVFKRYRIPLGQRNRIIERLIDENQFTMYHLMQAVTATANDPDLKPHEVTRLLRAGGDLPHVSNSRCDLGAIHISD